MKKHNPENKEVIKRAAEYLVAKLKENGITVMRYDAYTSSSVYLKLDDGVIGTLRISDHKSKKGLRYKYNLIKGSQLRKHDAKGVTRYYFPFREIELLVEKILYDRRVLFNKYNESNYIRFMEMNRERGKEQKGFWQQAKYV